MTLPSLDENEGTRRQPYPFPNRGIYPRMGRGLDVVGYFFASSIHRRCSYRTVERFAMKRSLSTANSVPPQAALFPGDELWDSAWNIGEGEDTIRRRMVQSEKTHVQFYSSWFCPFAQRTWIALEEANVDYQWNEINPYKVDERAAGGYTKKSLTLSEKRMLYPEFMEASPRGLVPALSHMAADGATKRVVWESLPACEYIDTVFGDGSLMPKDPFERAMVQIWCDYCTNRIQQSYYKALMAQDPVKRSEYLEQYFAECRLLARAMDATGPFFLGDRFSMVEVGFAPFWQRMLWIGGHYMQLTFPKESEFDRLHIWWEATSKRPSIESTFVSQPRLIASYSDYALNRATSDFAKSIS